MDIVRHRIAHYSFGAVITPSWLKHSKLAGETAQTKWMQSRLNWFLGSSVLGGSIKHLPCSADRSGIFREPRLEATLSQRDQRCAEIRLRRSQFEAERFLGRQAGREYLSVAGNEIKKTHSDAARHRGLHTKISSQLARP